MNQITRSTELPCKFDKFLEDFVEDSYDVHRRGSNFFRKSIVEINKKWFPELDRSLDGFWETNQYVHDDDYGHENSEITELNRVKKVTVMVPHTEWRFVTTKTEQ